ncbi:MAG: PAS domain S-box protein, partial [Pirellulaceae bacterium]|nr:PAS domain S-box protein [Pirellulaceae bacterium]
VAMIATDVDGVITQFNHAAEIMLGYSADEMIGRETPAVFHDANEIVARSAEMKKEGHPVEPGFDVFVDAARRGEMDQREWIYVRKDGSRIPVLLTVTALQTKQKEIYGFLGCAANISERKRAMEIIRQTNADLARSNEELAQFAYVASHDLQAPLRRITSYLDLLVEELGDQVSDKAADYIQRIIKGSHRMRALIDDLLLYSRIESSDQKVSVCKCGRAVQHAIEDLSDFIRESDATITVDNLPQIHAEPRQLKQLFVNLIGNAIKYRGDQPPRVHVSATSKSTHWVFAVEDNGIGIPEESRERVFGIFKRLHLDDQYSGNGIGLAICKRIVDRINGRIWVEESASGGCKFCFEVPKKATNRHD